MSNNDRLRPPLLLDGATATRYMQAGMPGGACTEQWAMENLSTVRNVAKSYAKAGSDVVYTPTFLANRAALTRHGLEDKAHEINVTLANAVKQAVAGYDVLVAGDMSTTGLLREPFGDAEFEELVQIYRQQALSLREGGVDLLVAETMSTLSECRAAVFGARTAGLPVFVSLTVDEKGETQWGDDLLASLVTLQELGVSAFGLNCSHGPDAMLEVFERLAPYAKVPLLAKPNTGSPALSPVAFCDRCMALLRSGVGIVGGCCGTDEKYVAALRHALDAFDMDKAYVRPADYDIIAANGRGAYFFDHDLEYSDTIMCSHDMADELLEAEDEGCGALRIRIDTPDDGYNFSLNSHLADMPVAFESESLEALESALYYYQGRAIIISTTCEIEREALELLASRYGAIVL